MARVRRSAAEKAALIDQWHKSGLSLPAFCTPRGVNAKTMSGWIHKPTYRAAIDRGRDQLATMAAADQPKPAFIPVRIAEARPPMRTSSRASVTLVIGPGRRVVVAPGFDAETLRRVVAVLEGRPC
jgi:hypothetical protein